MNATALMLMVALSAAPALAEPSATETPWTQVHDGDVKVFAREHAGGRVLEVKGEAILDATPLELQQVFLDKDPRQAKTPYVVETRIIKDIDANTHVSYVHLDLPVISDRDYFAEITNDLLGPDGKGVFRSSWKPWGLDRPARASIVRVTTNEGFCEVTAADQPGKSRVTYYLLSDPGGNLPAAFINMGNKRIMPDVMHDLQKKVVDRRARDRADQAAAAKMVATSSTTTH